MLLKNAMVMDRDFQLRKLDIRICEDKISQVEEALCGQEGEEQLDLSNTYILPGFIDTHIHGAYGVRISDREVDLTRITCFEATQGVTGLAITTASSCRSRLVEQMDAAVELKNRWSATEGTAWCEGSKGTGSKILGIHAEGPFLCKQYKGAMNADNLIAPDRELVDQMYERSQGLLKIMTVAPEEEGVLDVIPYIIEKGITVSMGHTNATYDDVIKATKAGALRTTHTFNAMRPLNHREPGVLGAALTHPQICCEMICDYVHLHPATVKLLYLAKGAERLMMVSDSGHAAGLNVTEFDVDGVKRYVKDGVVRLANGTIAGSAKTLLNGVQNLVKDGIPLSDVSRMASYNPAKTLGLEQTLGSIDVGKIADLVVLDQDLQVKRTFINGACVYEK